MKIETVLCCLDSCEKNLKDCLDTKLLLLLLLFLGTQEYFPLCSLAMVYYHDTKSIIKP